MLNNHSLQIFRKGFNDITGKKIYHPITIQQTSIRTNNKLHYPLDSDFFPVDSVIHLLNNWGLVD